MGDALSAIYRKTFTEGSGVDVLKDLELFCFEKITMFSAAIKQDGSIDPFQLARIEGRREVLMMIRSEIKKDFE